MTKSQSSADSLSPGTSKSDVDTHPANSISRAALLIVPALLLSAILTATSSKSTAQLFDGTLTANTTRVIAPAGGTIEWINVEAGSFVLPGHELFTLTDSDLDARLSESRERVQRIEATLAATKARSSLELDQRKAETNKAIFETEVTLAGLLREQFQRKFEDTAWEPCTDLFEALVDNNPSPLNLEAAVLRQDPDAERSRIHRIIEKAAAQNDLETVEARIELCETRLAELRTGNDRLTDRIAAAYELSKLQQQSQEATARLSELESLESELTIVSPVFGMVGRLNVTESSTIEQGKLLVELFDRDRQFVNVELPSRLGEEIRADRRVVVSFSGGVDRLGEIESVPPQVTRCATAQNCESLIAVRIHAIEKLWPELPIGTSVKVRLE